MKTHEEGLEVREEEKEEQSASLHGSSETFNKAVEPGGDLLVGLSEELVLIEIIPRLSRDLPWNERPLLKALNRSWAKAMAEDYPACDRLFNPDAVLSSGDFIIISHGFSYSTRFEFCCRPTILWVWSPFDGELRRLPTPPIRGRKQQDAKYLCDGDRLYALTPTEVRKKHNVRHFLYNVWMLYFRDFNFYWKRLPSLPNVGEHVFASSYLGNSYIWQRQDVNSSSDAGAWKLIGNGEKRNDFKSQWESIDVNMRPPKNMKFDNTEKFPSFIEVNLLKNNGDVDKILYIRHSLRESSLGNIALVDYYGRDYIIQDGNLKNIGPVTRIFLSADLDRKSGSEHRITDGELYCVGLDRARDGGLCICKAMVDDEKTRSVEEWEWDGFMHDWISIPRFLRDSFITEGMPNERTAIKFFGPLYPWRLQQKTKLDWNYLNEKTLDVLSGVSVVHNGPICAYERYKYG